MPKSPLNWVLPIALTGCTVQSPPDPAVLLREAAAEARYHAQQEAHRPRPHLIAPDTLLIPVPERIEEGVIRTPYLQSIPAPLNP
ncbi:MAG: hypothetical protein H7A44_08535 [Opitutaceae bacterium]|nr:hypothetical protein [Cephaloticoccus sp.]MCP5530477.1 hypothetical protein [Opitutaceae bacterium]